MLNSDVKRRFINRTIEDSRKCPISCRYFAYPLIARNPPRLSSMYILQKQLRISYQVARAPVWTLISSRVLFLCPFGRSPRSLFPPSPFLFNLIAPFYAPRTRIYARLRSTISHTGLMLMRICATAQELRLVIMFGAMRKHSRKNERNLFAR